MKLQLDGWKITNNQELGAIGSLFRDVLTSHLPPMLSQLMDFDGWAKYFRDRISEQTAGRAMPWAMLGYSLLARPSCTLEEIQQVIASHAQEDGSKRLSNRADAHLQIQRTLVLQRFRASI